MTLEEHDRSLYDAAAVAEADELVRGTLAQGPGPYALQAAISSLHSLAPAYAETDWEQIAALYALLARSDPVAGGRAQPCGGGVVRREPGERAAVARCAGGPLARLRAVPRGAAPTCSGGSADEAAARAAYERALELTDNPGERAFLITRVSELG